jgi:predicted transcriptional regulator with HTH domain
VSFNNVNLQQQVVKFLEEFRVWRSVKADFSRKILSDTDRFSGCSDGWPVETWKDSRDEFLVEVLVFDF